MDVRCEKCKTEYEFDDARITEAGVTVKCTTCGYVFKVKKKALFVTVPVKPDDAAGASPLTQAASPSTEGKEKPKEWKVRQVTGNVFNFKELTTLQKWIVERKVTREDEISLTGETWKKLGQIAELSPFFQVVDAAQKGVALEASLHSQPSLAPGTPGQAAVEAQLSAPAPIQLDTPVAAPVRAPSPPRETAPSFPAVSAPGPAQVTLFPPGGSSAAAPIDHQAPEPPTPAVPAPPSSIPPPVDHYATLSAQRRDLKPPKRGGGGWLLALLLLLALGGGGYWAYTQGMLPFVDEQLARFRSPEPQVPPPAPAVAEEALDAGMQAAEPAPVPGELAAVEVDAGTPEQDAGSAAQVQAPADAGTVAARSEAPARPEPVRDFDWYMDQGDRFRDRERTQPALEAYAQAAQLQPTRAEPVAGRGLALLDQGSFPQAAAAFQQALKLNPRYGVAVMGLAEAFRLQGNNPEAVKYYRRYLEISPNGAEAGVARSQIERLGN